MDCLDSCQSLLMHMLRTAPAPFLLSSARSSSYLGKRAQQLRESNGGVTTISRKQLPIPPSPTTAYRSKKRKPEEKKAQKNELDNARDKTRVNIRVAIQRWRDLRDLEGFKTNAELATFLLDR